jgi:hypothetical protein
VTALPIVASPGHYQVKPYRNSRKEPIVDPAMVVAAVTAVIGATGTVLAAWIQSRAQRGPSGNAFGPEKEAILRPAGNEAGTAPTRPGPSSR